MCGRPLFLFQNNQQNLAICCSFIGTSAKYLLQIFDPPCVQIFLHLARKHLHMHQLLSDVSFLLLWMPFKLILDILYVPHFAAALAYLLLKYALICPVFAMYKPIILERQAHYTKTTGQLY